MPNGNIISEISITDGSLDKLALFCQKHKSIYVFGAGKIGSGIMHYLKQSDIPCDGYTTTETINDFKKDYFSGKTGIIIGVSDKYLTEVTALLSFVSQNDIFILSSEYRERMGRQFSIEFVENNFWVNIFVTNRCNLGCKSCSTFAPATRLCKTNTDYDFDEFSHDIKQLRNINPTLNRLKFTGGEPFLHNDLFDMFQCARETFPDVPIECYTNGLLLNNMGDKLVLLAELKITLIITEYPSEEIDLKESLAKATEYGIDYKIISFTEQKYFSKRPLSIEKNIPTYRFFDCPRYATCDSLFMYRGKLWKCIYSFNSVVFNEAFSTEFKIDNGDWIDLYKTEKSEIYKFCINRIPFCGYCKPITELVPWGLSEYRIEEWT